MSIFEIHVPHTNTQSHITKLRISSAQLVADTRARIKEIETADLIGMIEDPNVVVIDIRDVREHQRSSFIPGSVHMPRGMIEFWVDPDSPYYKKDVFDQKDKRFVFYCASVGVQPLQQQHCKTWALKPHTLKRVFPLGRNKADLSNFQKRNSDQIVKFGPVLRKRSGLHAIPKRHIFQYHHRAN